MTPREETTHLNFGCHRPSRSSKYRGTKISPLSSRRRRRSRCASSTAVFARVAASMSLASIACVRLYHSLVERVHRSDGGLFRNGDVVPSRFVRFLLVFRCDVFRRDVLPIFDNVKQDAFRSVLFSYKKVERRGKAKRQRHLCHGASRQWGGVVRTVLPLNSMTWLHLPETSPMS